jgi:hypothetical protein
MHHSLCWNSITYTIHVGICMHVIAFNIHICYIPKAGNILLGLIPGAKAASPGWVSLPEGFGAGHIPCIYTPRPFCLSSASFRRHATIPLAVSLLLGGGIASTLTFAEWNLAVTAAVRESFDPWA